MRAIDTNVLIRLITGDDARQAKSAEVFIETGGWVSLLALAEATWVLSSVYELSPKAIARAIEMLLDHRDLVVQDAEIAAAAVLAFKAKPTVGFSDCLLLEMARKAGHLPFGTFDRDLAKLPGAQKL